MLSSSTFSFTNYCCEDVGLFLKNCLVTLEVEKSVKIEMQGSIVISESSLFVGTKPNLFTGWGWMEIQA